MNGTWMPEDPYFEMASSQGWWPFDPYEHDPSYGDDEILAIAQEIAVAFLERHSPVLPPRPSALAFMPQTIVGWSPPPHPVDVIVSFNPHASKGEKAAAVLLDYYHDNQLRSWADDGNVKKCFIGGSNPKKEDHDPLLLVAAHQNQHHKVWQCAGLRWKDLDDAVQGAIARRMKLGALPKASYDTNPIVIYYYDNDAMKRITYPLASVPDALNPANATGARYWAMYSGPGDDANVDAGLDKVHTLQTADPRKIKIERENPGWKNKAALKKILAKYSSEFQHSGDCPTCKGTLGMGSIQAGSAGGWDDEGFDWDRDVAGTGIVGSITGAILALVSAVLTATGVGAVVGVPLGIATPVIVAAINDLDVGLHTGDFGAGIAGLATAIAQAATSAGGKAGISLPPEAMKALAGTVSSVASAVRAGEQKKLDFGQIWNDTAKRVQGKTFGDDEAIAVAQMLTGQGPAAGHVFIQGYLAGKFLDAASIDAIAKLLKGMAVFADPRIINLGLLGMGFGHVAKAQGHTSFSPSAARGIATQSAAPLGHGHAARGEYVGQDLATKQYGPMSQSAVSALLARANAAGLAVTGFNPWFVDTHEHGVKLRIVWDAASGITTVAVTDKYPYVPNDQIWERLDALASASTTHVTGALSAKDRLHAFVQWRLVPRYTKHATSGPYDIADDIHQDERIEAAQSLLNQLRGAKPGDVLFVSETGLLDPQTRESVRSFQFEAGVGPYDGTPTLETLLALEAEVKNKQAIFAGEFVTGVGLDTHVPAGTLIYDAPNGHPISMIAEDARAMFKQRVGHWLQLDIDGTHVWVQETAIDHASGYATGQTSLTPPPDYGALSRGCPLGSWWDPFTSTCRATAAPPMPPKPQPMPGPPNPMPLPVSPEMPTPAVSGWLYYPE